MTKPETSVCGGSISVMRYGRAKRARRGPVAGLRSGAVLTRNPRTDTLTYSARGGGERSRTLRLFFTYSDALRRRHASRPQSRAERVRVLLAARTVAAEAFALLSRDAQRQPATAIPPRVVLLESTRPVHGPPLAA